MSDEDDINDLSFTKDVRVKFIAEKVCFLLQVQQETWEKRVADAEFRSRLKDFLQKKTIIYFSSSSKLCLSASTQVQTAAAQSKQLYVLKTREAAISSENYRGLLTFGLLSSSPLMQIIYSLQQEIGPLLTDVENHPSWPNVLSKDISHNVEKLCHMTSVVEGQAIGKTVLPIPNTAGWMEKSYDIVNMSDNCKRALVYNIETIFISWSSLIEKILTQDSSDLLQTCSNPGPSEEISFWASRMRNLEGIQHQLQSPIVERMAFVLEMMDSSYYPMINTLIGNVSDAFKEAQDVDLYLRPLGVQLAQMEKTHFPDMEKYTPALFHTVFLIWTNCQYYQKPARIAVLLQELCNLFIEQTFAYLPEDLLHREDTEDNLLIIKKVIKVLRCFKESYQIQKERLEKQERFPSWDFSSAFSHFNQFTNRMLELKNLCETVMEFQRLERIEFGGIKGNVYIEQVKLGNEFTYFCQALKQSKSNLFDFSSQAFEEEYKTFTKRISDFEHRLANLLCGAFKESTGLESALKMLMTIRPILERRTVRQLLSPSFILLQQLFSEELKNIAFLIKSRNDQVAPTSEVLKWAKMLKERIESPWKKFRLLFDMSTQSKEMVNVYSMYRDLLSSLEEREKDVYAEWCNGLEETCLFNLNQPLISRNPLSELISINFTPELAEILRDVLYIHKNTKSTLPAAAIAVLDKHNIFKKCIDSLRLIVQQYNNLKMLEMERPLIKADLGSVDSKLAKAETSLTWQDQDCWSFVQSTKELVQDLAYRVSKAKKNFDTIESVIKGWSKTTMYTRQDKKGSLIQLEGRKEHVIKKYSSMKTDGDHIQQLIQKNMVLFGADPASTEWQSYLECIDKVVVEGLFNFILHSLQFFLDNMELSPSLPPLFETRLILKDSVLSFNPSIDRDAEDGLYELVEELIGDIFKSSVNIQRVAGHLNMDTYQDIMDDIPVLCHLRHEIMAKVGSVLKAAEDYQKEFDCYRHLWQNDREEFFRQFSMSGRDHAARETEPYRANVFPETWPTTDDFKHEVEYYDKLHSKVSQLEDSRVFDGWLWVDCRYFKASLLNTIQKWSWLHKERLLKCVTNSLEELQESVQVAVKGLTGPIVKEDHQGFLDIMSLLLAVRARIGAIDRVFESLRGTIVLLEHCDVKIPEYCYTQMEELPEKWNEVKKLTVEVKSEIATMQRAEVLVLKSRCKAFEVKQAKLRKDFSTNAPFSYNTVQPYVCLDKSETAIREMERELAELQKSAHLFDTTIPDYKDVKLCRHEISILKELWDLVICVQSTVKNWTKTNWRKINVEQMESNLKCFARAIRRFDKDARLWDVYVALDKHVKNLLTALNSVRQLQSQAIRERHWLELIKITKVDFTMTDTTTLGDLLALQLHLFEEEISDMVDKAVKEMATEKIITKINQTWASMELSFEEHYQTSLPLIKCNEDLIVMLEDHQIQLQNVVQSKHVAHFLDQALELQHQLMVADCVLSIWMEVQRTWVYLESIFKSCEDICQQIPNDTLRFQKIDAEYKEIMLESANNKNFIEATNKQHLFKELEDLQKRLALCEKALAEYLEMKRFVFPRFYFVSSADLLDILSKWNRPKKVTIYLPKLFDSMSDLEFNNSEVLPNPKHALGMYSKEREYVKLQNDCFCDGPVEEWLTRLEESMRKCIRAHLSEAVAVYEERPRELWILDYPAQVALTGSQIWWNNDMELVFRRLEEGYESALKDYNKKQVIQLNTLIEMLLGELSPGDRQKIMTVCTIDVHARDIVSSLVAQKVTNSQAFHWLSQLRHRWNEKLQECTINICDAQFLYSYEYVGNTSRLVITPLTDRCYITLTQSLHLTMSGAPTGPAGTGKTETTKDLGRAMGVMVYIFNCSEQMDYQSIGNIYKGLAQTGAWGCFDEFNRIAVDVLSVVAVQVKTIQDAIRSKKETFLFLNQNIALKKSVGIFITMNPGYAGRAELPENLKALFRPCAMVVPDTQLICEIMLVAEGFRSAKLLAKKFTTLYNLCKELLSKQDHYDWGLRAVKSVLVLAGGLRRKDKTRPEDQILMRALRDFNMPKIVTEDVTAFLGLLGDLFPGLEVERQRNFELEKATRESTVKLGLQPEETFVLKVVQLEELLAVRHSVFVTGSAGTGKSQILRVLYKTYMELGRKPVWNDLNPKAIDRDELFGFIHPATREWKDGLLSSVMRQQAKISHPGPKWIVLDGDIDPMWIESLNTVMDDNKVLTLASNERVALTPSMRLMFEISHLRMATPATISRAGILYVNQQDLGWNPYVSSWIDKRERQTERAHLMILFEKYVPRCLDQMKNTFKTITPIPESSLVQTLCTLLDCLLTPENVPAESPRDIYETYFIFACIWAFGGALYKDQLHDYPLKFSQWWTKEMRTVKLPTQGTVFDYYLDHHTKRFLPWADIVPSFEMESGVPLQAVVVHTAETVRLSYFMDLLLEKRQPVMLVGKAGVGKTALVKNKLDALSESCTTSKVPFSYYTTSLMLQEILERPLEKRAGRTYAAAGNKRLVYFIDDMNIPAVDSYGTVQPHALIRQHLDYGHWYCRQKLTLKEVQNTQYVACMNPTAGSFIINPRLQRHFSVFAVNFPSLESQASIYGHILCGHLKQGAFTHSVQQSASSVVRAVTTLNDKMLHSFLPSAVKFHYVFNLRDISNIFQGILLAGPETVRERTDLVGLWLHESCRVYSDRLVDLKDLKLFQKIQMETVRECFEGLDSEKVNTQPLLYCHFANIDRGHSYNPLTNWSTLRTILNEALESYNELYPTMNLVLFDDAIQHVCRISRILEAPGSHGLLVGVGGSGKQSLTRLAAYMCSVEVSQIMQRKGYSIQDFKVDLAGLILKAGVKNKRVTLLLTDAQIPDDRFLVLINHFLASGEIPEIFNEELVEHIVSSLKREVRSFGLLDDRENCWRFFTQRVQQQLTVIMCSSPTGSNLRVRAHRFPALINCTTINWFHPWTTEALQSVSYRFIHEVDGIEPAVQESISLFMAYVHNSVNQASEKYLQNEKRYNYTTPKSFLQQITMYRNLLEKSRAKLLHKMNRLNNGLQKLQSTAAQVDDLQAKLASQETELTLKNEKIGALLKKIGLQTEKVSKKREAADLEAQKVAAMQTEIAVKRKDCEKDLAKAEPSLTAAVEALNTLNKVNLTEFKAFPNPPAAVTNVAAAVMVLLAPHGRVPKDRSWKAARAFMGKVDDFLHALMSYDKEHIPESCLTVVKQQYLRNPHFRPDLVWTKSTAAAGLCAWTINIVRYYEIYCEVIPKRCALSQANAELEMATAKYLAVQKKLADFDNNLQSLTAQFDRATAEKISCQEEVTQTSQTIELANRLVKGLMAEKERWSQAIVQYEKQQKTLCGDVLLTSAFMSYLGYFTSQYRVELFKNSWIPFLQSQKVSVALTDGLDPILMLTDDATVAAWHNQGLPNDRMSTENAAILTTSERWPLIIDPQQQAIKWIRNRLGPDLRVVRLGQKGYMKIIEQALICGETVLIENLQEEVDPILEPVLEKRTVKKGRYILIGDKECEYNKNFQLILHTKLANPHFPPELQAQTTLINFTVTPEGLGNQLLGQAVSNERPDLESLKLQLTMQQNQFKIELKKFEDDLLSHLSAASGNFLSDNSLVEQLENTKRMASHIQCKVAEARDNETKINEARELYRPAAERASLLFFIINDLSKINPMYQFSLKAFNSMFNKAIKNAEWDEDVQTRVCTLTEAITYSVFLYTSQGLFERDKLTFLSHIAFQILLSQGLIDPQEFEFLLHFPVEATKVSALSFLSPQSWGAIKTISTMEGFSGLDKDMESSPKRWRKIVESSTPENEKLPQDWKNKSLLQKLIILRALRPDRLTYALRRFVEQSMGTKYLENTRLEFMTLYEDSSPSTSMFFILSPGVDPLRDVEKLGLKLGFSIDWGTLHNVSLGQGQEEEAERVLRNASKHGQWVILQNVHLAVRWLPLLDALLEMAAADSHASYRVFITAEPAESPEQHMIPRGVLENAIKITNEPPSGMNPSLHAALNNFSQETLDMSSREQEFNLMLFSLCFFHACVTERRKFGPQGWNHNYPFSTGDLTISANVLYNYLEANSKVPWEDLCYLFGDIMYGGHITDIWDRRLCKTYLQQFMHPKMYEANISLCLGFLAPPYLDYTGYHVYIDENLPAESPMLYGLHPNAELECLTVTSENLFRSLWNLQPQDLSRGEEATESTDERVIAILEGILERLPEEYNVSEMMTKTTDRSPYVLVCFQECERMNLLLLEIRKSLNELNAGLKGEFTTSSSMETLQSALFNDLVPDSWARLAFPSTKTLAQWLNDLNISCHELDSWSQDFVPPAVVWLSGLFNPQSFLTAVLQSVARKTQSPLDKMTLTVDVTKKMKEDFGHPPREGAYIHGLFMEGARWDIELGVISEAFLRDLTPAMPVLYVRAILEEKQVLRNTFECPVYRTKQRGSTYVWAFHLRTKEPPAKWVVAGAALLLSV
ncbi:PREDICTED: dynein heavy chain 11, axonemal [Cyprinodon variegatus]|uniref:dynein heavy chain 11, axonemal n=1 Tax=Cyprinodon variegatus TaxID=28743 RepID=UPI0007428C9B|nr:PREDICTED: dynein heavy chain 11, axonemal [Cyprinodon variegatus]